MDHEDIGSNISSNRPFREVLWGYASRRGVIKGGLAAAVGTFLGIPFAFGKPDDKEGSHGSGHPDRENGRVNFTPVAVADGGGPEPNISADYRYQVLIPWGTALDRNAADYSGDPDRRATASEQARQVGIGHDGMRFFPFRGSSTHGLLALNHEYGENKHVLGKPAPANLEEVRRSQNAHGISVVEIRSDAGRWELVKGSQYNRRVHVNTPVEFSGPVAGSGLVHAGAEAKGTLNNCSNGFTPWGTYLTCEENFNYYFNDPGSDWKATTEQARYGISRNGLGFGWGNFDDRFSLATAGHPTVVNSFGWVVEVDPFAPDSKPVKRTALGRFKHEGIAIVEGSGGRIVGYMGDDEANDYIYKFVSDGNWQSMRARGLSPLDHGTLYAARFDEDGSGEWLELSLNNRVIKDAGRFSSEAELLTYARIAADIAGATPMDRPEWTAVAPNGDVYCTLTANLVRKVADAANPLAPNPHGHIIRWRDSDQHTGRDFNWDIFIVAADTHGEGDERTFSGPDGLWIDPDGRLFIQTDAGQRKGLNNQMLVASTSESGGNPQLRRLFTGVIGDEITGITVTPDRRTMFINIQHPGNGDPTLTNFPAPQDGVTIPRDCTIVINRKDGGIIGS